MQVFKQQLFLQLVSVAVLLCSFSYALSQDGLTLLEIKSAMNDTKNALSNWLDTDDTPCRWTGISCQPENKRVTSINLPYMQLGGTLSPSIWKLSKLQRLAIHQNSLHGNIPHEIGNCTELRAVYLQDNYLQGHIPSEIGNLVFLAILDLSSNLLKGAIPSSLGRLTKLQHLNLSTNFFYGEIPDVGALSTFANKSFIGNLNLCGPQVRKPCRTSLGFPAVLPNFINEEPAVPRKNLSRYKEGVIVGALSMLGVAITVLLAFLWIWLLAKKERAAKNYTKVRKQQQVDAETAGTKLITFRGKLSYPSYEIIEKLESLGEEDVVGSGGFGTVYRMVMSDCTTFAVKRIDGNHDQMFESELEILGSIKHINLVNIRGYCKLPVSKLIIYDYLANGSLADYLHARDSGRPILKWSDRLKIALGSARGLAYLHHDCSPRIVHLDIKSSNILLDENLVPHVSDFGLAKLLVDDEAHMTTVIAGTPGYLAPEYLQSGRATEKSDVYSFGVLLLELVSGKRPTDSWFSEQGRVNIVGWLNTSLVDDKLVEIVDVRCRTEAELETIEAILEIARRCTDSNPDARPAMCHVLQLLEGEIASPCPSIKSFESKTDSCLEG